MNKSAKKKPIENIEPVQLQSITTTIEAVPEVLRTPAAAAATNQLESESENSSDSSSVQLDEQQLRQLENKIVERIMKSMSENQSSTTLLTNLSIKFFKNWDQSFHRVIVHCNSMNHRWSSRDQLNRDFQSWSLWTLQLSDHLRRTFSTSIWFVLAKLNFPFTQSIIEMILWERQWSYEEFMEAQEEEVWEALVSFHACTSAEQLDINPNC